MAPVWPHAHRIATPDSGLEAGHRPCSVDASTHHASHQGKDYPMATTAAAPATFDPEKFRQTTRAQWETAAEAWDRWGPLVGRWLGAATEAMLDMSRVGPGSRVLDVAAGAGEQTLS